MASLTLARIQQIPSPPPFCVAGPRAGDIARGRTSTQHCAHDKTHQDPSNCGDLAKPPCLHPSRGSASGRTRMQSMTAGLMACPISLCHPCPDAHLHTLCKQATTGCSLHTPPHCKLGMAQERLLATLQTIRSSHIIQASQLLWRANTEETASGKGGPRIRWVTQAHW
jgi:hypothetical protein